MDNLTIYKAERQKWFESAYGNEYQFRVFQDLLFLPFLPLLWLLGYEDASAYRKRRFQEYTGVLHG